MSPDELRAQGFRPERQRPVDEAGDVGCVIPGTPYFLGLYKSKDGLDYWRGQQRQFAVLEPNKVGARNGLKGVTRGAEKAGICREIVDVSGESVWVQITAQAGKATTDDACGEALKVAQQIEPKLPK